MNIRAKLAERYAKDALDALGAEAFYAVEIQGVRNVSNPGSLHGEVTVDNENPTMFSVYLREVAGFARCVGDFKDLHDAHYYAIGLGAAYDWPVFNFVKDKE